MDEINFTMKYINNFVDPSLNKTIPKGAELFIEDKKYN